MKTAIILIISYLVGAIPFGLVWVKLFTGKDVRTIASGRTGGTNAMRAGGLKVGLLTAFSDIMKGYSTYWIVNAFGANTPWVRVFAALMAVIGHNYSIFLLHRNEEGKLRLRGGAGGATALGGSFALWSLSGWIILSLSLLLFATLGYASVTTMGIAFFSSMIFLIRVLIKAPGAEWAYVFYGLAAEVLLLFALRPNLKRLREGNERRVNWRSVLKKKEDTADTSNKKA